MTREEIVTALRCCAEGVCHGCKLAVDQQHCQEHVTDAAADLIENQQREIEALRQANEGLRFNLAAYVGGGVPDTPGGDEICR